MLAVAPPPIARDELRARQEALAADIRQQGLDGLLVWGQGGSTLDAYGHVFFLTNHYPPTLRINIDIPPYMAGWGNTGFVLTADGRSTLVVESPSWQRDLVEAGEVRQSWNLYHEVAQAVVDAGLSDGLIGVAGEAYLPLAAFNELRERAPSARFRSADDLVFRRRMRKSEAELAWMRHASAVGCQILEAMLETARVGASDREVVIEGYRVTCELGAVPYDFTLALGERLPRWDRSRTYAAGDLVSPDVFGCVDGFFYDVQRTLVVGGRASAAQERQLEAVSGVIGALCDHARPGVTVRELARLKGSWLYEHGLADAPQIPKGAACGHGMGVGWEQPFIIEDCDDVLEAGMVLAFETALSDPAVGTVIHEDVVIVTEGEPEVITGGLRRRWW